MQRENGIRSPTTPVVGFSRMQSPPAPAVLVGPVETLESTIETL